MTMYMYAKLFNLNVKWYEKKLNNIYTYMYIHDHFTSMQADRKTDRQTDRWTDRQTDIFISTRNFFSCTELVSKKAMLNITAVPLSDQVWDLKDTQQVSDIPRIHISHYGQRKKSPISITSLTRAKDIEKDKSMSHTV